MGNRSTLSAADPHGEGGSPSAAPRALVCPSPVGGFLSSVARLLRDLEAATARDDRAECARLDQLMGGSRPGPERRERFRLDFARQGREGIERIRRAAHEGTPYSVVFIDVQMPPGWDGIETTRRIANIARTLGGSLQCESDGPGSGATFTLELPVRLVDGAGRSAGVGTTGRARRRWLVLENKDRGRG